MNTVEYPAVADTDATKWEPLLVTAHLAEPVVGDLVDVTLDGPLSWGAYQAFIAEHGDVLPEKNHAWAVDFELPVAKWAAPLPEGVAVDPRLLTADGQVWGWCVSDAVAGGPLSFQGHQVRRKPALEDMATWSDAKRHHVGLGPLKARNATHAAFSTSEVSWIALGDLDGVTELLSHVKAIGRMTRHGMGRVARWTVAPHSDREGWRQRRLPSSGGWPIAVRAPHYHASRRVPCL